MNESKTFTPVSWVCGEDFCELCGDCLSCHSGDPCFYNTDRAHMYANSGDDVCYPEWRWHEENGKRVLNG